MRSLAAQGIASALNGLANFMPGQNVIEVGAAVELASCAGMFTAAAAVL